MKIYDVYMNIGGMLVNCGIAGVKDLDDLEALQTALGVPLTLDVQDGSIVMDMN